MRPVSVMLLNYNGRDLLKRFLPSVIRASKRNNSKNEVMVVDNASSDGSVEFLRKNFPVVRIVETGANLFYPGFNVGVRAAKHDIVVLLNTDMETKEDFIDWLVPHFKDKSVFAVRPSTEWKTEHKPIPPKYEYVMGFFRPMGGGDEGRTGKTVSKPVEDLAAGVGAFDKKKFLKLGGFDKLYIPGYYEDIDLGYRARKRGFRVVYEPRSKIYHRASSTFKRYYDRRRLLWMNNKNRLIFTWKNITDFNMIVVHLAFLPFILLALTLIRGPVILKAFYDAAKNLPEIMRKRGVEKKGAKLTDKEVFAVVGCDIIYFRPLGILKRVWQRIRG